MIDSLHILLIIIQIIALLIGIAVTVKLHRLFSAMTKHFDRLDGKYQELKEEQPHWKSPRRYFSQNEQKQAYEKMQELKNRLRI